MQNSSQAYRGPGAPGVNFAEHNYDNHLGAAHCQPSGYQPYSNPPYHPIPSPRPHHYANHQMQQSMPYRHHGGAYAPNQNQYGQNMNQEMYRNHHSSYVGGGPSNPRSMSNKPWSENNSPPDMMPPYGQVSHSQMMNNSPQMPVNTMRSPPHATSNMNPTPPQSQQHYRQMQSPAHSPHSWSQAQIPSPGVMHSSRTTPSPLQTHARSPGHSQQPFSPPAMTMQPHPQPPENGQIPPVMNAAGGTENHNPSNPLHSLQKMVMLDQQDPSKVMLPMMGDGSDQFANQCGSHSFVPDESASNESRDSAYSTYYNMDENRFESKPNIAANDTSAYSTVQQVSNCNFSLPQHPLNSEEKSPCVAPGAGSSANLHESLHPVPPIPSLNNSVSSVPLNCPPIATQGDCTLVDCPPHAESAPIFTDQIEAAVATNSEQALQTNPNAILSNSSDCNKFPLTNIPNSKTADVPGSSNENVPNFETLQVPGAKPLEIKTEIERNDKVNNISDFQLLPVDGNSIVADQSCETAKASTDDSNCVSKVDVHCKKESSDDLQEKILNYETIKLIAEVHKSDEDNECIEDMKNPKEESCQGDSKSSLQIEKMKGNSEDSPDLEVKATIESTEAEGSKSDDKTLSTKCDNLSFNEDIYDSKPLKDLARNPVKVVIHRIRKDDTNDTWHVPGSSSKEGCQASNVSDIDERKPELKIPNVGPQIVILSPASSSQKKFGFQSSVAANNVITIDEDITVVETESLPPGPSTPSRRGRSSLSSCGSSPDKKRGRPVGSKNKMKPATVGRKRKGRKGNKKKKPELSKTAEIPSKPNKKVKVFSGPYVHIIGSKDNPSSIKVVNVAQKEEEKVSKVQPKRSFNNTASRIKKKPVGHLSTLSPTYDAFNRDKTWLCVFCHKGSHIGGLGDLYGPYYIKDKNPETTKSSTATPSTSSGSTRGKRRKSEASDDTKGSKKAKHSTSHESTPRSGTSHHDPSIDPDTVDMREVWIHEDCAVWCQSISLMGEEVHGLEESIIEARENTCSHCSLNGATLGCWGKSCKQQYHYSCAKDIGCQMDIEKFSLLCSTHQKKVSRSSQ